MFNLPGSHDMNSDKSEFSLPPTVNVCVSPAALFRLPDVTKHPLGFVRKSEHIGIAWVKQWI